MPVRDGARTVDAAVRSTLRALPQDAELVIWDDASTDKTVDVIGRITDHRVRVISAARARGPGGGLAALMYDTDSEFVARMDADDICLPGRFSHQLRPLMKGECDLVFSTVWTFRSDPFRLRPPLPLPIAPEATPLHLLATNLLCHPSMVATRAAIELAGGYRQTPAEDYDLWLRACVRGLRLTRVARATVAYRHHADQVSAASDFTARAHSDERLRGTYRMLLQARLGIDSDLALSDPHDSAVQAWRTQVLRPALLTRASSLGAVQRRLLGRTVNSAIPDI